MSDAFEEDFRTALLADSAIAAAIATRAAWGQLPQAQPRPLLVLWDIVVTPEYTMRGIEGLESRIVQIDCRAETFAAAKTLARDVRARLETIGGTIGATEFQRCFFRSERDMGTLTGDPVEPDQCVQVDTLVWFRAA